jgi:hypothetical protein
MNTPLSFPFGFNVNDNTPIDGKYGVIDSGVWRPYTNIAEVISVLPSGVRHIGLTVNVAGIEYWWRDGVSDINLIIKTVSSKPTTTGYINQTGL